MTLSDLLPLGFGMHLVCLKPQVDGRRDGPSGSPSSIRGTSRRIRAAHSRRSAASSTACRMATDREMPPVVSTSRECSVSSSVRIGFVREFWDLDPKQTLLWGFAHDA